MKVAAKVMASIGLAVALVGVRPEAASAAECTCAGSYLSCLNSAAQTDGILARFKAEQGCNLDYYYCVKAQILGA